MRKTAYGRTFEAPRPGAWEIESTHFPRPITPFVRESYLPEFKRGFAEGSAHYGLFDTLDFIEVHGFVYSMMRDVGAAEDAKSHRPKWIVKLLSRWHPEFRKRIARSAEVLRDRCWLEDLADWDRAVRPEAIAGHVALQSTSLRELDDSRLIAHLHHTSLNASLSCYRRGRFAVTACLPVGDYLAHAREWTGLPAHVLLRPLEGYGEGSNGVAASELDRLAAGLREDDLMRATLDLEPAEALMALRDAPGSIGADARTWLDLVSYRIVTGYDVCDRYGLEMPQSLVQTLKATIEGANASRASRESVDADTESLRDRVPAHVRPSFDTLLGDARSVYRLRAECDHGWAAGLMRRALLEAGRRAAGAGALANAELMIDAGLEEAIAILRGRGPSSDELSSRAQWRKTADLAQVPRNLGFAPTDAARTRTPAEWLPPPAARLARAAETFSFSSFSSFSLFVPSDPAHAAQPTHGITMTPGTSEKGRPRIVRGAEDFADVQQGEGCC